MRETVSQRVGRINTETDWLVITDWLLRRLAEWMDWNHWSGLMDVSIHLHIYISMNGWVRSVGRMTQWVPVDYKPFPLADSRSFAPASASEAPHAIDLGSFAIFLLTTFVAAIPILDMVTFIEKYRNKQKRQNGDGKRKTAGPDRKSNKASVLRGQKGKKVVPLT